MFIFPFYLVDRNFGFVFLSLCLMALLVFGTEQGSTQPKLELVVVPSPVPCASVCIAFDGSNFLALHLMHSMHTDQLLLLILEIVHIQGREQLYF
jgi:hypothetical protein